MRASLTRVEISLPEYPSVRWPKVSNSESDRQWCSPACSLKISYLTRSFGIGTKIFLWNRLKAAMSNSQGILVVANTDTCFLPLCKLSIYLRNSVLMRRSVSLSDPDLFLPSESISSIRIMEGPFSSAISKSIRSSFSLSPINLEVMSARLTQKQVAAQWKATA